MPQIYIHLSGEPSKILLQKRGIIKKEDEEMSNALRYLSCPNCNEPNKKENKFCLTCKMVLSYNSYSETIHEEKIKKDNEISELKEKYETDLNLLKDEMDKRFNQILCLIQQNPLLAYIKPEALTTKRDSPSLLDANTMN